MIKISKIFFFLLGLLVFFLAVITFMAYLFLGPFYPWFTAESEEMRISSPDSQLDAVVTIQLPGAFGSSKVRLYIVPRGEGRNGRLHFLSHKIIVDSIKWADDLNLTFSRNPEDSIYYFDPVFFKGFNLHKRGLIHLKTIDLTDRSFTIKK